MSANPATLITTTDTSINADGTRRYTVLYHVETTEVEDQGIAAIQATGIPSIGYSYAAGNNYDLGAYVKDYSARLVEQDGSRKYWEVNVVFATPNPQDDTDTSGDLTQIDYPWLKPARIHGYGVDRQKEGRHYADPVNGSETDILNSANDRDPEPPLITWSYPSMTIEKDFQEWPEDLETYANTLNLGEFFGYPQGYWRMMAPRWSRLFTGAGQRYYNITFEFEFSDEGTEGHNGKLWYDKGLYAYDPVDLLKKRIQDDYGIASTTPLYLNGAGFKLAAGFNPVQFPDGVNSYRYSQFGDLGIPTNRDE